MCLDSLAWVPPTATAVATLVQIGNMLMPLTSKTASVIAIAGAIALTAAAADAHSRHKRAARHAYGAGTYAYVGNPAPSGGTFVYGPSRAPYGSDLDYPLDFQLQGKN